MENKKSKEATPATGKAELRATAAAIDVYNIRPVHLGIMTHYIQTQIDPNDWIVPLSEGEASDLLNIDRLAFRALIGDWLGAAVLAVPVPVPLPEFPENEPPPETQPAGN